MTAAFFRKVFLQLVYKGALEQSPVFIEREIIF
jgi:hypothetical protein